MADLESGTYEIDGIVAERVLRATLDASNALAVVAVCLDFLRERATAQTKPAVDDALCALQIAEEALSGIRETASADSRAESVSR